MKILIIKRDKIGDLLLTTPMLRHLRSSLPDAEIHLLANDYNAWVVKGNPDIDRLWIYPRAKVGKQLRFGAIVTQFLQNINLRNEHYDVVIAAGGEESERVTKRALRIGGKRTIAYCGKGRYCAKISDALPEPADMHELERMLYLLSPLGIKMPDQEIYPWLALSEEWQRFASEWLREHGLAARSYVVIGLGARKAKRQPGKEQILRWAAHFKEKYGLDTVFMWTPGKEDNPLYPGDDDVAKPVLEAAMPYIHPFRGPLMPALGLVWQARTSIFPDSGLMHLAAASPGGVLGLFAHRSFSTSPIQWEPRGARTDYLESASNVTDLADQAVYEKLVPLLA